MYENQKLARVRASEWVVVFGKFLHSIRELPGDLGNGLREDAESLSIKYVSLG